MIIRVENHKFWDSWGQDNRDVFDSFFRFDKTKRWTKHQFRENRETPWHDFHGDQDAEWIVFKKANQLDEISAKLSISMGLPQIMGANYTSIGYDSVQEMFTAFNTDERTQLIGFFDFIQGPHQISRKVKALQERDFLIFASQYNGPGQAAKYAAIIRSYFEAFATLSA